MFQRLYYTHVHAISEAITASIVAIIVCSIGLLLASLAGTETSSRGFIAEQLCASYSRIDSSGEADIACL